MKKLCDDTSASLCKPPFCCSDRVLTVDVCCRGGCANRLTKPAASPKGTLERSYSVAIARYSDRATRQRRGRGPARRPSTLLRTSVIQSVGMLFFREDFEPRRPSKRQEVLMESDGVVFIDGSLIEDGAL